VSDAKTVERFLADIAENFWCSQEDDGGHEDPSDCWHCSAVHTLKAFRRLRRARKEPTK
jgi:hypothetical protein